MDETELARRFEEHRPRMRGVAYRMLGSLAEADEAVQDTWLRVSRAGDEGIENFGGWLTTIVARVCLNLLQARKVRPEDPVGVHVPDPIITTDAEDAEHDVLLADAVGLALQVVLETLPPAERVAFVLHDLFDLPFEEIAPLLGRNSTAARQLASRARRRVAQGAPAPEGDVPRQRQVVDAFFAAARGGDLQELLSVLDPDVVLRSDGGAARPALSAVVRGAQAVASRAMMFARPAAELRPALINGAAGVVVYVAGQPISVMGFTVRDGRILAIDSVVDPDRLAALAARPVV
jgi:RNA polymerase sigma factor (sigma-70 family)